MQRLADKYHQWESNGVKTLIPNELLQGLLGYAYTCPDMIGGGDYLSFLNESTSLDEELFVRYAQCAALMPMMQFSAAPWRVLSEENARLCVEAALLHIRMSDRIISLARHAAETGEPVVRYMEYQFPGQGLEAVTDQFMLGRICWWRRCCRRGRAPAPSGFPRATGDTWTVPRMRAARPLSPLRWNACPILKESTDPG